MYVPITLFVVLIALALPTVLTIAVLANDHMRDRGRRLVGNVETYDRNGTTMRDTHLFYIRIWRSRSVHSTGVFD